MGRRYQGPRFVDDAHRDDDYYHSGKDHGTRDTFLVIAVVMAICFIIAHFQ